MLQRRKKEHINLLVANNHYNTFMQNVYNKHKEFIFTIVKDGDFSKEELSLIEIETIRDYRDRFGSNLIMNLTNGGDGGRGHIKTPAQIEASRKWMVENNPSRKISREEVLDIYSLIKEGKTNSEIGEIYKLNPGYISQIRIGDKYKDLFHLHFKESVESPGRQKLSYEQFLEILDLKNNGLTNKEIGGLFKTDTSAICRLLNKKTYSVYWKKYLK